MSVFRLASRSARTFKPINALGPIRFYSQIPEGEYEQKIYNMLNERFSPARLEVQDVSGGCGSMFAILVESKDFKGIPMIKQHRLVNELLKDEISQWHGLQLKTKGV